MVRETLKRWMLAALGWVCYHLLRKSDIAWYITTNGQQKLHMVGRVIDYEIRPRDVIYDWESRDDDGVVLTQFSILELKRNPEGEWSFITEEEDNDGL